MSTVMLKKWGNSVGIVIPVDLVRKAQLAEGETLEISVDSHGILTLAPVQDKQAGWLEQFNRIADSQTDARPDHFSNAFDEDEWSW